MSATLRTRFFPSLSLAGALMLSLATANTAHAQLTGFIANPTTNSTNFNTFVTSQGATVNTNVNFDTHPIGALQNNFYTASDGVTFFTVGDANTVAAGTGPDDGNDTSTPLSPGEGPHPASNYLFDDSGASSFGVSFTQSVSGVGLFTIDYFNPTGENNPLTIEAYAGQNGTGALLGSFNSVVSNFQSNNLYFMGLATTNGSNSIGSFILRNANIRNSDIIGLDNLRFSRVNATAAVPEPSEWLAMGMAGTSVMGLMVRSRRRKSAAA
ncbi:MAG: PEP-CTERM sorting domain-containing protein [Armatimonadota bacterium]